MTIEKIEKIIISQTDNIGDMVLTLPMASVIKASLPHCKVVLLARSYTRDIVNGCGAVDEFLDWESVKGLPDAEIVHWLQEQKATALLHISKNRRIAKLAKKADIPMRVGTSLRLYHWKYCNKLVFLFRRNSLSHDSQLNLKLLKPLGIYRRMRLSALVPHLRLEPKIALPPQLAKQITRDKFNLIVHPGSHGHGREWPTEHFIAMIKQLPRDRVRVFITGSPTEEARFRDNLLAQCPEAVNLMGQLNLAELVSFIQVADGLIASGTGPLHVAAALGIKTLGLFPPRKGISPRRWSPLGQQGEFLVHKRGFLQTCLPCRESTGCACMAQITVSQVIGVVNRWLASTSTVNAAAA